MIGAVHDAIRFFLANDRVTDANCPLSIDDVGGSLQNAVIQAIDRPDDINLPLKMATLLYRFACEFDIRSASPLPLQVEKLRLTIESNDGIFAAQQLQDLWYAQRRLPADVIKHLLNSDEVHDIRNLEGNVKGLKSIISSWKEEFQAKEDAVGRLREALEKHTTAYNFVGLAEGFREMRDDRSSSLAIAKTQTKWVRFALLVPAVFEILYLHITDAPSQNLPILVATGVASLTITFLLVYFFRLAVHEENSIKAQLVQLDLRLTLCRFIQNYADYSEELKKKNPDTLSKFENLIFSGLVINEEKLPSTFDGIEQMANLAKSLRGEK